MVRRGAARRGRRGVVGSGEVWHGQARCGTARQAGLDMA